MKLEGKDLDYFLQCAKEAGIKVTPGTGKITMNGKPINIKEVLEKSFPGTKEDTHA